MRSTRCPTLLMHLTKLESHGKIVYIRNGNATMRRNENATMRSARGVRQHCWTTLLDRGVDFKQHVYANLTRNFIGMMTEPSGLGLSVHIATLRCASRGLTVGAQWDVRRGLRI